MTYEEIAEILDEMADGDGYAIVDDDLEIKALRSAADILRALESSD